jgi:hypothetical protein
MEGAAERKLSVSPRGPHIFVARGPTSFEFR